MKRILKAARFAAEKHKQQKRKNAGSIPYINHPLEVADLLANVGDIKEENTIIAALLHDTIEDTKTSTEEIRKEFGDEVLKIVKEVTDDRTLPSKERKRLQVINASHKSQPAKQIKLADKICNIKSVIHDPPVGWNLQRRIQYLKWSEKVINGVRGCCPPLEKIFDELQKEGRKILKEL